MERRLLLLALIAVVRISFLTEGLRRIPTDFRVHGYWVPGQRGGKGVAGSRLLRLRGGRKPMFNDAGLPYFVDDETVDAIQATAMSVRFNSSAVGLRRISIIKTSGRASETSVSKIKLR